MMVVVNNISVKGLTNQFGEFILFGQSIQESNQISTFYYFHVFLMYFQLKSVHLALFY